MNLLENHDTEIRPCFFDRMSIMILFRICGGLRVSEGLATLDCLSIILFLGSGGGLFRTLRSVDSLFG